jgi:hypothetical protein
MRFIQNSFCFFFRFELLRFHVDDVLANGERAQTQSYRVMEPLHDFQVHRGRIYTLALNGEIWLYGKKKGERKYLASCANCTQLPFLLIDTPGRLVADQASIFELIAYSTIGVLAVSVSLLYGWVCKSRPESLINVLLSILRHRRYRPHRGGVLVGGDVVFT